MKSMLGDEYSAFAAALADPEEGLRVNSLRLPPSAFKKISPFELADLDFAPEAFALQAGSDAGKHPYHAAGLYYLQDPGAMAVGSLVKAQPGERVLDLAAAPGGKATHLAAQMAGAGLLVANDINRSRARELVRNVERLGIQNAIVTSESLTRLADHFGAYFDRVLVDAPCSGESMFHKSERARADWNQESVEGCARRQSDILRSAAELVAPQGRLIYSTCTFSMEENERVLDAFLREFPAFEPSPLAPIEGAEAVPNGATPGSGFPFAYRLWPHRVAGAGHFVGSLRRREGELAEMPGGFDDGIEREALRLFRDFAEAALPDVAFDAGRFAIFGRELHQLPTHRVITKGLSVLRSGLWLGTVHRSRFEPSHALALAAPTVALPKVLDLSLDDPRLERYLEGHPIESAGEDGWMPVAVEGFNLGWGKRVGSAVKNHYPKGLRRPH